MQRIREVLGTGWLGHGQFVMEFEGRLKLYLGASHVVAVSSGTAALHIALDAIGVRTGDEVIVPSLTFCGCVQAITALNAKPVFCEVSPQTLNIDVADARKRITSRTRAIMPVHYCGNACDMDALLAVGRDYDVKIIEDAAHAFGSSYHGRKLGSFGDLTCFSFDPIKNITCGEGGAVALSDEKRAQLIRHKRLLGIDRDGWLRHCEQQSWLYDVSTQGYRYHMSNINAAIGLAQMEKLDGFLQRRRHIAQRYNEAFSGIEGIKLLEWNLEESCPFAYVVRIVDGRRDDLIDDLKHQQVATGVNYIPNHLHSHFVAHASSLPVTERLWREIVTLPLYCDMKETDVSRVIESVYSFFARRA